MKVASWNVNSLNVRLPQLLEWLERNQPDIIGLQELKMVDERFPVEAIREAGYHAVFNGQKTYNGVAILSKEEPTDVVRGMPGLDDEQRRYIAATIGGVRFIDLYVPNGQALGSEKFQYKTRWFSQLLTHLEAVLADGLPTIVVGDFNIAHADEDVHDPSRWVNTTHTSGVERGWLDQLLDLGFVDTFRKFEQEPDSFSWWDYRGPGIWKNHGLRIDYVFASQALADSCNAASINKRWRMKKQPSDHAPVIAEFG